MHGTRKFARLNAWLLGTTATVVLISGAARAQQQTLENVTVTAQRVVQQLQDVPMSVQAISMQQMQIQGIQIPRVHGHGAQSVCGRRRHHGIDTAVSIRGINEVGLYVDGVWQPSQGQQYSSIVQMQRVEILYGPQGTLFGRNTNGGAINYVTVPPADKFGIHGSFEIGDFHRRFGDFSVDVPLSDTLLTKWTAAFHNQGGWAKSVVNQKWYGGNKTETFRGDVLWQPSESFSVRVTAEKDNIVQSPDYIIRDYPTYKYEDLQDPYAYDIALMNPAFGPFPACRPRRWTARIPNGSAASTSAAAQAPGHSITNLSGTLRAATSAHGKTRWSSQRTRPGWMRQNLTATVTWNINPHLTFTNLASYIDDKTMIGDNNLLEPMQAWYQLRPGDSSYWQEEAHLTGDLFDNAVNYLLGFYYLRTNTLGRTYSWAYTEFYQRVDSNPIINNGNYPVLDQNLMNFIHQWGVLNANTPIGQTIDPYLNQTYAQLESVWKPDLGTSGGGPTGPRDGIGDSTNNDYSVFLNATWHITPALDLQGGLRAAWNDGTSDTYTATGGFMTVLTPANGGGVGPGCILCEGTLQRSSNPYPGGLTFTPMATATYHWTPDINTYVRYAQGYTTPEVQFNSGLQKYINLASETVTDYEAGLRADWLNHRLRTNLTGYYFDWDGQRITQSEIAKRPTGFADDQRRKVESIWL